MIHTFFSRHFYHKVNTYYHADTQTRTRTDHCFYFNQINLVISLMYIYILPIRRRRTKKNCLPQNVWDVQRFSFQMNLNLCFSTPFVQLFSEQQLHSIIILIYSHSFSSAALFFWLNEEREKINKEIVFVILMSRMCVCVTNSVENLYNILRWLEFPRIRTHMQSKLHT